MPNNTYCESLYDIAKTKKIFLFFILFFLEKNGVCKKAWILFCGKKYTNLLSYPKKVPVLFRKVSLLFGLVPYYK